MLNCDADRNISLHLACLTDVFIQCTPCFHPKAQHVMSHSSCFFSMAAIDAFFGRVKSTFIPASWSFCVSSAWMLALFSREKRKVKWETWCHVSWKKNNTSVLTSNGKATLKMAWDQTALNNRPVQFSVDWSGHNYNGVSLSGKLIHCMERFNLKPFVHHLTVDLKYWSSYLHYHFHRRLLCIFFLQ